MYWITYRAGGKTYQHQAWYATDEYACTFEERSLRKANQNLSWFRIQTETGRVVLEG